MVAIARILAGSLKKGIAENVAVQILSAYLTAKLNELRNSITLKLSKYGEATYLMKLSKTLGSGFQTSPLGSTSQPESLHPQL